MPWSDIFAFIQKNWNKLTDAPLTFFVTAAVAAILGVWCASLYYGERFATVTEQLKASEDAARRYRVALGIDKASDGALIELTDVEMKAKALGTAAKVRALGEELNRRINEVEALQSTGRLDDKGVGAQKFAIISEFSVEFERGLRADALNVDSELRRRLGPRAVGSIVGVPPSFYSASDGAPIGALGLVPSGVGMSAAFLGVLSQSIDQMAQLLPTK